MYTNMIINQHVLFLLQVCTFSWKINGYANIYEIVQVKICEDVKSWSKFPSIKYLVFGRLKYYDPIKFFLMRHSCIILRLCIYIDVKTVMFFKTFRGREMTIWNRCFACPIEFWHHSWSDFLPRQQKTTHQLTSLLYRLIYFCHVTFFQSWKKSFEWKNNVKIQYYFS